eukprot:9254083-Lingulodinium_polyedra.AAC.1
MELPLEIPVHLVLQSLARAQVCELMICTPGRALRFTPLLCRFVVGSGDLAHGQPRRRAPGGGQPRPRRPRGRELRARQRER